MSERIIQLWTEGNSEYKTTAEVGLSLERGPTVKIVTFREYSRRRGRTEWLPENRIIRIAGEKLAELAREMYPDPTLQYRKCEHCGAQTRISTAGCDHCDVEDK